MATTDRGKSGGLPAAVSIRFAVTPSHLARAMAIEARDALMEHDDGSSYGVEHPAFAEYVRGMGRTAALRALRSCLRAYGDLSWPEDYPHQGYLAGLAMAREWANG